MSCLVLLHSAAQMQLHDHPPSIYQQELSYARSCLDVLEYCAEADKVADRFANTTRTFYNALATGTQLMDVTDVSDMPVNTNYLFSIPPDSPPDLAQVSCDLLRCVTCPFDSPSNLHNEGKLKAGLGAHVTLPFNNVLPQDERSWSAGEMALSNMPAGKFMGSPQPHGWDVFLNFNTL